MSLLAVIRNLIARLFRGARGGYRDVTEAKPSPDELRVKNEMLRHAKMEEIEGLALDKEQREQELVDARPELQPIIAGVIAEFDRDIAYRLEALHLVELNIVDIQRAQALFEKVRAGEHSLDPVKKVELEREYDDLAIQIEGRIDAARTLGVREAELGKSITGAVVEVREGTRGPTKTQHQERERGRTSESPLVERLKE